MPDKILATNMKGASASSDNAASLSGENPHPSPDLITIYPVEMSELGKHILKSCPKAYVNEAGQVIDPCHVWWTETGDPANWDVKPGSVTYVED
jgi:hypothetical protein